MDSCVCVYVDDFQPCKFCCVTTRTARKAHVCTECGGAIQPGDRYEYAAGKWGDEVCAFKTCMTCADIKRHLFCNGASFGDVMHDLRDHLFQCEDWLLWSDIAKLTEPAKDVVCAMIDEIWRQDDERKA